MIYYATNNPSQGYEVMGSFNSPEEARARFGHHPYSYCQWGDDDDESPPEWTRFPAVPNVVNDFAAFVESFDPKAVNNFVAENSCETDRTSVEALFGSQATSVSVSSIPCLDGTFCGVAVDNGMGAASRFVAVVVKWGVGNAPRVLWKSGCRSLNQAKTEAEVACRSFATAGYYWG